MTRLIALCMTWVLSPACKCPTWSYVHTYIHIYLTRPPPPKCCTYHRQKLPLGPRRSTTKQCVTWGGECATTTSRKSSAGRQKNNCETRLGHFSFNFFFAHTDWQTLHKPYNLPTWPTNHSTLLFCFLLLSEQGAFRCSLCYFEKWLFYEPPEEAKGIESPRQIAIRGDCTTIICKTVLEGDVEDWGRQPLFLTRNNAMSHTHADTVTVFLIWISL